MRLSTIRFRDGETAAVSVREGLVTVKSVNEAAGTNWETDLYKLICSGRLREMTDWYNSRGKKLVESMDPISWKEARIAPLYRTPSKIFGIGLNYKDHAADLLEKSPQEIPASFIKPHTTIIGPGDEIKIPLQSQKTTGEAELGVIMGRECENIEPEDWLSYVAGFTTVLDMTAEDILRLNPRYLTLVKSFETFLSFGPELVTPDEISDIKNLVVHTVHNGMVHAKNSVSNMTFPPDFLVSFHSKVFKWLPGDILSTGTPRAVPLAHRDTVECRITGFRPLLNPVVDKKLL